jgi:hypothetical protein
MKEMNNFKNTHEYDGKIDISQLPDLIIMKQLTIEQKKQRGMELLFSVNNKINATAYKFLQRIVDSIGTSANIDNTNGLVADDLICICWVYRDNPIFIMELEYQLLDMATGFCPQGRTHRLFQILLAFYNYLI